METTLEAYSNLNAEEQRERLDCLVEEAKLSLWAKLIPSTVENDTEPCSR
jgi:hypothetical protein